MKNIQPFIDLGFYTVPLKGELIRLEDGTKSIPKFEKNWKSKYQKTFNEEASILGGTITGAISNIIAIDCDSQDTYDLFRGLDRQNTFHFISKGKPKGGGTILYKYPTGISLESFSIQSALCNLDFYSDNGFIYLPTKANQSKERWEFDNYKDLPDLFEIPKTVLSLLLNFQLQYTLSKTQKIVTKQEVITQKANYLAPQLELFVAQKKFIPSLFRTITPKDFRDLEQYKQFGYLHPNQIPEGRGSEYLMKISAILGADSSVSSLLYSDVLNLINSLWEEPLNRNRLVDTIMKPMVGGKSSINGEVIWKYDEDWKTRGLTFTTKLGDVIEVFFDDIRALYYLVNYTKDMIKTFNRDSDLMNYIEPIAVVPPSRKEIKSLCPIVRTGLKPYLPFGFYSKDEYNRRFNIFKQSPALAILNDPKSYKDLYNRPNTILNFIKTLVPNDLMRNYLLSFLRVKLTTFKYSPVILYFIGTHGSGKDTLVAILANIIGEEYIARPVTKEFLEQYNGWLVDKYFVQLDEYGNQLHSLQDKETALGKIKAYTGKPSVQIRQMRTDGFNYKHLATFISTANKNPLMIEDEDRRVALIETPNTLKNALWVSEAGGMTEVINKINKETNDFCYYLATKVNDLTPDEYMSPPDTEEKRNIIADKLPAAQKLAYFLNNTMFEQLEDLMEESMCNNLVQEGTRIYEEELFSLYTYMTEGKGTRRGLAKMFKQSGLDKIPTTKAGEKKYYYHIPALAHFKPSARFEVQEDNANVDMS